MSRIGKQPISVPQGVSVDVNSTDINGTEIVVQGPKGRLNYLLGRGVKVQKENGIVTVLKIDNDKQSQANYGTTRARINNMVEGVTKGWKKSLELNGVGFTAKVNGQKLTLTVGFSHEVNIELPPVVKCSATKTTIDLESPDKDTLGTVAAKIRQVCPPEPYLGKGIKYTDEVVRRKAGKTGKK